MVKDPIPPSLLCVVERVLHALNSADVQTAMGPEMAGRFAGSLRKLVAIVRGSASVMGPEYVVKAVGMLKNAVGMLAHTLKVPGVAIDFGGGNPDGQLGELLWGSSPPIVDAVRRAGGNKSIARIAAAWEALPQVPYLRFAVSAMGVQELLALFVQDSGVSVDDRCAVSRRLFRVRPRPLTMPPKIPSAEDGRTGRTVRCLILPGIEFGLDLKSTETFTDRRPGYTPESREEFHTTDVHRYVPFRKLRPELRIEAIVIEGADRRQARGLDADRYLCDGIFGTMPLGSWRGNLAIVICDAAQRVCPSRAAVEQYLDAKYWRFVEHPAAYSSATA